MSTRAVFEFVDQHDRFAVYKHMDGYPEGALQSIKAALDIGWQLPRYEACELSAAFVAANKSRSGNIYLSNGHKAHGDLSYWYEISSAGKTLHVNAYHGNSNEKIFDGSLEEFSAFAAPKNVS